MNPARHRLGALALVLVLHGTLWLWPWGPSTRPAVVVSAAAVQAPVMLWLRDLRDPAAVQQTVRPLAAPKLPRAAGPLARTALADPRPADANLPQPGAPAFEVPAAAAVQPEGPPPGSVQAAAPPVLNLALPRAASAPWRQGNPAVQAQIGGAAPRTVERAIAQAAAQTGPWSQERIGNDRILMRRGDTCFTLDRPRSAQLFPMDPGSQRLPWMASNPFKC